MSPDGSPRDESTEMSPRVSLETQRTVVDPTLAGIIDRASPREVEQRARRVPAIALVPGELVATSSLYSVAGTESALCRGSDGHHPAGRG